MTDSKTIIGIIVVTAGVALAAGPAVLQRVHAEAAALMLPDIGQLSDKLPQPLQDFINSAKQISSNLANKAGNLTTQSFSATDVDVWDKINSWFTQITRGISLVQIVKTIGNLLVWILTAAANLLKWLLSLIH